MYIIIIKIHPNGSLDPLSFKIVQLILISKFDKKKTPADHTEFNII